MSYDLRHEVDREPSGHRRSEWLNRGAAVVSDAVTIVGIVTPAALAVAGLVYSASREDKRAQAQRGAEVEKEAGEVLDNGAQALTEVMIAFERRRRQGSDPDETGKALAERYRDARRLHKRITIRLGPDSATTKAYGDAIAIMDTISKFVYKAHGADLDTDESEKLIESLALTENGFLRAAYEYRRGRR
jgi:hypothetical protein